MTVKIMKSELPDLSQWEEMELVECIGTPEEHADPFYRYENYGIETHPDGSCQAYVIINGADGEEEPIMVAEGFDSPEAVIDYFRQETGKKEVVEEAPEGMPKNTGDTEVAGAEEMGPEGEQPDAAISVEIQAEPTEDADESKSDEEDDKPKSKDDKMQKSAIKKGNETPIEEKTDKQIEQLDKTTDKPAEQLKCSASKAKPTGIRKDGLDETVASSGHADKEMHSVSTDLDTIAHADKTKLPPAKTDIGGKVSVPTGHTTTSQGAATMKSFKDMMAEREAAKNRGLPNGFYQSSDLKKSAKCQGSPGYGIGRDKDWIDMMPKTPTGQYSRIDGVNQKFMKSEDTIAGMIERRRYGRFMKSDDDPMAEEEAPAEVPEEEPVDETEEVDPTITGGDGAGLDAPVEDEAADVEAEEDPAAAPEGAPEGGDGDMSERIQRIQNASEETLALIDMILDSDEGAGTPGAEPAYGEGSEEAADLGGADAGAGADAMAGAVPDTGAAVGAPSPAAGAGAVGAGPDPLIQNQKPEQTAGL